MIMGKRISGANRRSWRSKMELKAVTHDDKQYVMHIDRHVTDVSFDTVSIRNPVMSCGKTNIVSVS